MNISFLNDYSAQKSFIETNFWHNKDAKATCLACEGYSYEDDTGAIGTAEVNSQKALVRQSAECIFHGKVAVDFLTCDRHLLSGVPLRISFRQSIYDFKISFDDAGKPYKVKIIKTNFNVEK